MSESGSRRLVCAAAADLTRNPGYANDGFLFLRPRRRRREREGNRKEGRKEGGKEGEIALIFAAEIELLLGALVASHAHGRARRGDSPHSENYRAI